MTKEDYCMTRSSFGSDKSPKSSPDLDDTACQDGRNAWHPARSSNSTKETTVSSTPWLRGSQKAPLLAANCYSEVVVRTTA